MSHAASLPRRCHVTDEFTESCRSAEAALCEAAFCEEDAAEENCRGAEAAAAFARKKAVTAVVAVEIKEVKEVKAAAAWAQEQAATAAVGASVLFRRRVATGVATATARTRPLPPASAPATVRTALEQLAAVPLADAGDAEVGALFR